MIRISKARENGAAELDGLAGESRGARRTRPSRVLQRATPTLFQKSSPLVLESETGWKPMMTGFCDALHRAALLSHRRRVGTSCAFLSLGVGKQAGEPF